MKITAVVGLMALSVGADAAPTQIHNNALNEARTLIGAIPLLQPRLGSLPHGIFTSDAYSISNEDAAKRNCDNNLHCAAISYRRFANESELTFHTHSFVPMVLSNSTTSTRIGQLLRNYSDFEDDDDDSDLLWDTYISDKDFVFHPGRMVTLPGDVLKFESQSSLSLSEAEEFCHLHPECVGFTFPTHSSRLRGYENITFARSMQSIEDDNEREDRWRTFLANDLDKSFRVSDASTNLPFVKEFDETPFRSCCRRTPREAATNEPQGLPNISELQSVDTLPRIPCNISKADFLATYEEQRQPVVLVGCDAHWPAKERWSREGLLQRGIDNATTWRSNLHKEKYYEWKDIVDDISAGVGNFYIFDQLDEEWGKLIEQDYETPSPFQGKDLYPSDFPPDYGSLRWWCVGPKNSGADPHMDPYGTDAWNSVTHGHKWWVLYPPSVSEGSVGCDEDCSVDDPTALDWYTSVGINALRTAVESGGATPMHVLLSAGETIYVPYGMVHSVLNIDDTTAITANYGSPGNLQRVWQEVLDDGNERFYKRLYYDSLDAKQRKAVREGEFWPPEDYLGDAGMEEEEEDDDDDEDEVDELAMQDLASLEAERDKLYQMLRSYERDFVKQHHRDVLNSDDLRPVATQHKKYVLIKKAIGQKKNLAM